MLPGCERSSIPPPIRCASSRAIASPIPLPRAHAALAAVEAVEHPLLLALGDPRAVVVHGELRAVDPDRTRAARSVVPAGVWRKRVLDERAADLEHLLARRRAPAPRPPRRPSMTCPSPSASRAELRRESCDRLPRGRSARTRNRSDPRRAARDRAGRRRAASDDPPEPERSRGSPAASPRRDPRRRAARGTPRARTGASAARATRWR